jgi:2-(1,2-epoxy-1,2-dihydrophenyl)acetyl-CoA isomerase
MSGYETVGYAISGQVATITLNRPDVLNAFNATLRRELIDAITRASADEHVRVVVLTGAGRAFCTGTDLAEQRPADFLPQFQIDDEIKPALVAITKAPKPFIAAVNGVAAGGGVGYVLACDLVVMADDASLLQPFVNIGLIPDAGASWHLVQQLGRKRAYELIANAEKLPAQRCVELGLANRVVPAGDLLSEAQAWAQKLAQKAPLALRYAKQTLQAVETMELDDAISYEAALQNKLGRSLDAKEGVRAFMEKRKPVFTGR